MQTSQLTFTRFVAAIAIVIFHYGQTVYPFNKPAISFLFENANVGVSYFFILSGFVMILAYGGKANISVKDFLKRRLARIYPVYFLALVLLLTVYLLFYKSSHFKEFLLNLSLLQSWYPGFALSFNFPAWSLSVEVFFYLCFPFIFNYCYKNFSFSTRVVLVSIVFALSQVVLHWLPHSGFFTGHPEKLHDLMYYLPPMHLNEFLVGNITGIYFLQKMKLRNYDLHILVLVVLLVCLLKFNPGVNYHNGMLAFVFVPLLLFLSANKGIITTVFRKRIFVFLGEISYGIYILQPPIFNWVDVTLMHFNIKFSESYVQFFISLMVLIVFSALSYKLFETPIRKWIVRW